MSSWTERGEGGASSLSTLTSNWPLVFLGASLFALAIVLIITSTQPRAPLAVMVGATAGLQTAQIAGVHVFCLAVALWLVLGVVPQQRGKLRPERPAVLMVCAALLASTALIGDLTNSRLVALQLLLLAATAACLSAFGDQADIRHILRGLLITTTIASVAALLQYVGVLPYAVFLGTDRPIGLYTEPDWLGMFSAVGLIIAFRTTTGRLRTALVFLHLTVLLLAAARAAWLAVLVVVVVGYVAAKLSRRAARCRTGAGRRPTRGGGPALHGRGATLVRRSGTRCSHESRDFFPPGKRLRFKHGCSKPRGSGTGEASPLARARVVGKRAGRRLRTDRIHRRG